MRRTASYNLLDHGRNEDIFEELKVDPVKNKLALYKQNRLHNMSRMEGINNQNNSITLLDLSEDEEEEEEEEEDDDLEDR
jgi:hypothetical protein